jgi:hypothetical protein
MQLWVLLLLLGLVKVPIAALMLWIPLRSDEAMSARDDGARQAQSDSGEDGGSRTPPHGPRGPLPRHPAPHRARRGAHGSSPPPPSPRRIRHTRRLEPAKTAR